MKAFTCLPGQADHSPSEVSLISFICSSVAGWVCQFEQEKVGRAGSKRVNRLEYWREGREDKKRLWQSSIWPRLLSERSLACQISVLTVNSHICAEHRRVSCTMVSWFRIRLDKAIGRMTHTPHPRPLARTHTFKSLLLSHPMTEKSEDTFQSAQSVSMKTDCGWKLLQYFKEKKPFLAPRLKPVPSNYWTMKTFHCSPFSSILSLCPCNNLIYTHPYTPTHIGPITASLAWIMQELDSSLLTIAKRMGLFLSQESGVKLPIKIAGQMYWDVLILPTVEARKILISLWCRCPLRQLK